MGYWVNKPRKGRKKEGVKPFAAIAFRVAPDEKACYLCLDMNRKRLIRETLRQLIQISMK
jgi:hypothetical protein